MRISDVNHYDSRALASTRSAIFRFDVANPFQPIEKAVSSETLQSPPSQQLPPVQAFLLWIGLLLVSSASSIFAQESPKPQDPELRPFLLGGIQTHELDHQRWMAALHQAGMNAVQVTVYAHQGPWNTSKLWYHEEEPAVLQEIRTARQNGLQVVLVLRIALDHNEPENRFLWHGLIYPETEQATEEWFRIYTNFVLEWSRVAEEEGVEVLGIASEMNSLAATLPVDEIPGLAEYYLDEASQERLRKLVGRTEHLFTEEARLSMGAGDFEVLDDFLVQRNQAERGWARVYTFEEAEDRVAAINHRRRLLEKHWRKLTAKVRDVYSGRLTLAANFDNYHEVAFWDALDLMGINAYFPLRKTLDTPLSEDGLTAAWKEIFRDIEVFQETHELSTPVLFTELGYTRREGVTVAPWSSKGFIPLWDPEGETDNDRAFFWASQPFAPQERALAMQALHRLWSTHQIELGGVLYWKLSSVLHLQRFEPFMLYLGSDAVDPLYAAFIRFAEGIRPLAPATPGEDAYLRAVDAIVRDDLDLFESLESLAAPPPGHPPLLHLATRLGRKNWVGRLVKADGALDRRDAAGFLPIHWACYQDDPDLVEILRPSAKPPWRDDEGETPLMKCARLDNEVVARELLRLGDPMQARNERGQSALHLAADQASVATVETLMAQGADVDALDEGATTPLHLGAQRGDADIVKALAKDTQGRPNREKNRPVHAAAYYGKAEAFRLLFDPSQALEVNTDGQTLLHLAAYGGHLDILGTLLPHFPDVDPKDDKGWTPLFYAIQDAQAPAVELLLRHGASARHRDAEGSTPLHYAGSSRESHVIQHFLRQDIALDLTDRQGNTALHHAAGWGRLDNIRLLLEAGADSSLRNRDGETPLDIARDSKKRRAAELLSTAAKEPTGSSPPQEAPGPEPP